MKTSVPASLSVYFPSSSPAEQLSSCAAEPITLQLRYLQTVSEIASENDSAIVFPIPVDMIQMSMKNDDE